MNAERPFDVVIVGAGFSGSMLATILAKSGRRVALIDRQGHPRFAIGESSTPLADSILRYLGDRYDQPEWVDLSTYGSWKRAFPTLACGLKRGFSYYRHQEGLGFDLNSAKQNSLLVAASRSDAAGDTHWYRPEVDEFLFRQATEAGVHAFVPWTLQDVRLDDRVGVKLLRTGDKQTTTLRTQRLVDASGQACVVAKMLGMSDRADRLATKTWSSFGHIEGLPCWTDHLVKRGYCEADPPFDPDAAAVHHVFDDGWLWNLRFDNGVTSVGFTSSSSNSQRSLPNIIQSDPDLSVLHATANWRVAPKWYRRNQCWFDPVLNDRCVLLPSASLTLDPLHSTGIALALAGVERVADLLLKNSSRLGWNHYRNVLTAEALLLDRLVSTAYRVMADFDRFVIACCVYFITAIRSEERVAAIGLEPGKGLYESDEEAFRDDIDLACDRLVGNESTETVRASIRRQLARYNTAGLLDPAAANRYAYTATK